MPPPATMATAKEILSVLKKPNQALIAAIIIIVSLLLAGVFFVLKPKPEQVTISPPTITVDVAIAEKQTLSIAVHSQGTVRPRTETTLMSEVSGKVIAVAEQFESGGIVTKDALLLAIDQRNYEVEVKRAEAAVAGAKSNLLQAKGLAAVAEDDLKKYPRKHATPEALSLAKREPQLEEAKARLQSALADLNHARNNLSRTEIRSPYHGIIKARSASLGQFVSTGSQVGQIFSVDRAEIRLPIPMDRLAYLDLSTISASGPGAKVRIENEQGQLWLGRLVRTERVLDERSRVLFAIAEVEDPYQLNSGGEPLRIGSFVKAEISGKMIENLVAIPRHILRTGSKIWVLDDKQRLTNREVKTLRTEGKWVYVYEGLEDGDRICLTSIPNAIAGTEVTVNHQTKTSTLLSPGPRETLATLGMGAGKL